MESDNIGNVENGNIPERLTPKKYPMPHQIGRKNLDSPAYESRREVSKPLSPQREFHHHVTNSKLVFIAKGVVSEIEEIDAPPNKFYSAVLNIGGFSYTVPVNKSVKQGAVLEIIVNNIDTSKPTH